jgi:predicted permease
MMVFHRVRYWIRGWGVRLRVLFRRESWERDLEEELRFHLDQSVAEHIRSGLAVPEARRQALLAFGGVERFKEQVRENRGGRTLDEVLQDLRYAFRTFRRRPAFTLTAVGVLGLGVGASTTLFSAVNGVLLRPLPYADSERLLQVGVTRGEEPILRGFTVPQLLDLMERTTSLEAVLGARGSAFDLLGDGEPERITVSRVTPDYFRVLGFTPVLGRSFDPGEHSATDPLVAIVSHALWKRRWGGRPDIVGLTFQASEEFVEGVASYTIVGVAPPGFENPDPLESRISRSPAAQVWMPLSMDPVAYAGTRWYWRIPAVGKAKKGLKQSTVIQELSSLGVRLAAEFPDRYRQGDQRLGLSGSPLLDVTVGSRRRDLLILLGATGFLLLIAYANVAGLLLARASDREKEMGVRSSLGAGTRRLIRQLLTESLVLGLLGGLLGVCIAFAGVQGFKAFGPADFPRLSDVVVDPWVLTFGLGTSLVAGLLFGLAPACISSKAATRSVVRENDRSSTATKRFRQIRGGLVAGEIALALVLLTGSGLLFRSFIALQAVDPGLNPRNLILMQVNLPASYSSPEDRTAFFRSLAGNLRALPGVQSATHTEDPPMGPTTWSPWVWKEGEEVRQPRQADGHALGIPILEGRPFGSQDDENGALVAVVNETMARDIWPGETPVGKRLGLGPQSEASPMTVVGVSRDVRQGSLADDAAWELYLPYAQMPESPRTYMLMRTDADPRSLAAVARQAVWQLDSDLPVPEVTTMEARIQATLHLPRFRASLLGTFALVALILASAGIYGTMQYVAARRTREIGIRLALGAGAGTVVALVVRQGIFPVGLGLAIGLGASLATTRLLESLLFGVSATDPTTFILITATLGTLGLLATFTPAWRAVRANTMDVLGQE